MLQAALVDRLLFDLFPFMQDGFVAAKVDIGRCDVVQALVVTLVVVILDEGTDLTLKIARKIVVFQEDAVFHCLMPALDLALGLRVEGRAADVLHFLSLQPFRQVAGDVARAIITEQTRLVTQDCLIATGCRQGQFDRVCHVLGTHVCAEFPGDDIATVIVQNCAEVIPAPADNLEVGEVGLPHLVDSRGFVSKLFSCLDHHIIGRRDQISRFQYTVSR